MVLAFFLAILLFGKKNQTDADKILNLWMLIIGVHVGFYYLFRSGLQYNSSLSWTLGLQIPFPLIHPPILFLYVAALTGNLPGSRRLRWHFLPIGLAYLMFWDFFALSPEEKVNVYLEEGVSYASRSSLLFYAFAFSGIYYITRALVLLYRHRRNIEREFSSIEKINLLWLRYLIIGLSIIWAIVVFLKDDDLIYAAVVFYIVFIGYFGIRQIGIFSRNHSVQEEATGREAELPYPDEELVKYKKSGLDETGVEEIRRRLAAVMQKEKPYVNPELTLTELAEMLNIQPNHLSQAINSAEGGNFYEYVNRQRVSAFLEALAHPHSRRLTLLALAYDCGFNSKASFNRNFKKSTGLTPSEYVKTLENRDE